MEGPLGVKKLTKQPAPPTAHPSFGPASPGQKLAAANVIASTAHVELAGRGPPLAALDHPLCPARPGSRRVLRNGSARRHRRGISVGRCLDSRAIRAQYRDRPRVQLYRRPVGRGIDSPRLDSAARARLPRRAEYGDRRQGARSSPCRPPPPSPRPASAAGSPNRASSPSRAARSPRRCRSWCGAPCRAWKCRSPHSSSRPACIWHLRERETLSWRAAIGTGLLALSVLARPECLVLVAFALGDLCIRLLSRRARRRIVRPRMAVLAGAARDRGLVIGAWIAFNYATIGRPLPTTFYAKSGSGVMRAIEQRDGAMARRTFEVYGPQAVTNFAIIVREQLGMGGVARARRSRLLRRWRSPPRRGRVSRARAHRRAVRDGVDRAAAPQAEQRALRPAPDRARRGAGRRRHRADLPRRGARSPPSGRRRRACCPPRSCIPSPRSRSSGRSISRGPSRTSRSCTCAWANGSACTSRKAQWSPPTTSARSRISAGTASSTSRGWCHRSRSRSADQGRGLKVVETFRPDYLAIFPHWYPEIAALPDRFRLVHRVMIGDNYISAGGEFLVLQSPWARVPLLPSPSAPTPRRPPRRRLRTDTPRRSRREESAGTAA